MVSDTVAGAVIGVAGALLGTLLGIFAEPVRVRFARKAHQEQLRRTVYGELLVKLERVAGYYRTYKDRCESDDLAYLRLADKQPAGPITFPDEVTAHAQYYQLTSREFELLAAAYHNMRLAVNLVNKFGFTPFNNVLDAKQACNGLQNAINNAKKLVALAFKGNTHFLENIDDGVLLKKWRQFVQEPWLEEYLQA